MDKGKKSTQTKRLRTKTTKQYKITQLITIDKIYKKLKTKRNTKLRETKEIQSYGRLVKLL